MPFYIPPNPNFMFCMYNFMMSPFSYTQFPQTSNHMVRTFDMIHPYGQYTNQATNFSKIRNDMLDASLNAYQYGLLSANDVRACCNTFNEIQTQTDPKDLVLYADDMPTSFQNIQKPKTTIFDLDRLIFPEDPIRDWVEKRVAEIESKYLWADKIYDCLKGGK